MPRFSLSMGFALSKSGSNHIVVKYFSQLALFDLIAISNSKNIFRVSKTRFHAVSIMLMNMQSNALSAFLNTVDHTR